jgi:hypothetical protein
VVSSDEEAPQRGYWSMLNMLRSIQYVRIFDSRAASELDRDKDKTRRKIDHILDYTSTTHHIDY